MFGNVRSWAEHALTRPGDPLTCTRTVTSNRVVSFLMCNLNYHLEHHLFPGVPWYNLPALHALLADEYRRPALCAPVVPGIPLGSRPSGCPRHHFQCCWLIVSSQTWKARSSSPPGRRTRFISARARAVSVRGIFGSNPIVAIRNVVECLDHDRGNAPRDSDGVPPGQLTA